ncbi:hypothetical protein UFOVP433_2 [uncultured Caudovirales phage]|uniref:Uncharacterized protein n=1 Tax=uncultured Caudovirales phage TaxID=2100421 RepID=A0A6J5NL04_9CAUD|nr:hypothetical protein UFOVP433_2 [uncultured Caudovirales phage]CAB4158366.1 hypothetical protein UFOVP702_5 [uncultured Caudovirales phage]
MGLEKITISDALGDREVVAAFPLTDDDRSVAYRAWRDSQP